MERLETRSRLALALGLGLGLALSAIACGSGENSVALYFPNEQARAATMRILIYVRAPDLGGAGGGDCTDLLALAPMGKSAPPTDPHGDLPYPFSSDQEIAKVPAGKQIIYALAFAGRADDDPPILQGCSDSFNSREGDEHHVSVPVHLQLVLPANARLEKVAGDRQVGREGEALTVPLAVHAVADVPNGHGPYAIPGVDVEFVSKDDGFTLDPSNVAGAMSANAVTAGERGEASIGVHLPMHPGAGEITATAAALAPERSSQTFSVSVTETPSFPGSTTIHDAAGAAPVGAAIGDLDGDGAPELAVLSCVDRDAAGSALDCALAASAGSASGPFGRTRLAVFTRVGSPTPAPLDVVAPEGLGILPAGIVAAPLEAAAPQRASSLAILDSRRERCQSRVCGAPGVAVPCPCFGARDGEACPCEGSEVLVLRSAADQIVLEQRLALTASNAVSLAAYAAAGGPFLNLAAAAAGRVHNTRPCRQRDTCLPYDVPSCATAPENCGCPPEEFCNCPGCTDSMQPGVCTPKDKFVDVLSTRTGGPLNNENGCQQPVLRCNKAAADSSTCVCLDTEHGNSCTETDDCRCKSPVRSFLGAGTTPPRQLAAGPLRSQADWDLAVASEGGLELVKATNARRFVSAGVPTINGGVDGVAIGSLDSELDQTPDVVWYARASCTDGKNFNDLCPFFRPPERGQATSGCLGVLHTDGRPDVFVGRSANMSGCRRYFLYFQPDGMCTGRFNDDPHLDVALSARTVPYVAIFSGDGRGGLLDPEERVPLPPGGMGGPITCGDLDGDGKDDIAVLDAANGSVYLLRSRP